ncbi:zinc finger CCHC domain-containing protein 3-like [Lithobates pipiens]
MEESVQNNPQDFPPLVDPPPAPQGDAGPSGHVTSWNAWSCGAPSFSTSNGYTGQAFKRRNVVRFKHRGSREELPDRRFVVRDLLCHQMGFVPADILAVINLPDRQDYYVSFKLMSDLDRFWASFSGLRDKEGWRNFLFIPISKSDTANVNIILWNESVPPKHIAIWLRRYCEMVSELIKTKDSDGIWTGGWRVLVKLRQSNNVTHHLPNSFFIGRERGVCFYAGQPRLCFKCGKSGHVASVCTILKCNLCGEVGHISSTCETVKCNLCGGLGHFHRDCSEAFHNMVGNLQTINCWLQQNN